MEHLLKEMINKDHMVKDISYNSGLKKLRLYGVSYLDDDVRYYLYCNGIGSWHYN